MKDVIVITGVGKRLGYELAIKLLEQGYLVEGTYRTEYPELENLRELGANLHQIDFYQPQQLTQFISYLYKQYTSLRAIVHNASDWSPDKPEAGKQWHSTEESLMGYTSILQKMMAIHVSVPYQMNMALQELLSANEESSDVIHISDYVVEKGSKKHIAYSASKAALNNLTLSFAALLAPKVKVNTISPALLKFNEHDDDEYKDKALRKALIPREAGFNEVIDAVFFILASKYMTGRNVQLDGGRHLK
ncbi:dihydromonapterin reductase [Thalassotalea euphylliae]|uniref:dihydromonapterin reductase n=1 Tax=Thalassotalea euphylliae TaxID=1655234 RepID=UPI0036390183